MKIWCIGYFYHGYLKQLQSSFERYKNKEFANVAMWYPYMSKIVVKEGCKRKVEVPIFDNYVLFQFEDDSNAWRDIIKKTPIINFLKDDSTNRPLPITDEEYQHILIIENKERIVNYSNLVDRQVIITNGPFEGFVGHCKSIIKGKYKARVFIEMFGLVERNVEIPIENIRIFNREV